MRISCPACAIEYEVPATLMVVAGRKLKCSQCNHQWQLQAQMAPPLQQPLPQPFPRIEPEMARPAMAGASGGFETARPGNGPGNGGVFAAPAFEPVTPRDPFTYDTPNTTADILASLARKQASEPSEAPMLDAGGVRAETGTPDNDERFAALVKSSRTIATDDQARGRGGLFTTIILLLFFGAVFWVGHDQIVHAVPAAAPLYNGLDKLFGIKPN